MKLSMWILADYLCTHVIRCDITDGSATICGVRFVSEEQPAFASEYVYVGRAREMFDDVEYLSSVVLMHGYDMLFIDGQSVEDVINSVLTAFEHYNSWEASLWAAAKHRDAMQRMVDLSEPIMSAPMAIANSTGRILAYTAGDGPHTRSALWRQTIESGCVSQSVTSSQIRDRQGRVFSDWSSEPRIYVMDDFTCIGAQIISDGEYVAALFMQEFDKVLTQGDVQLAAVFCTVLTSLAVRQESAPAIRSRGAMISAILDGQTPDDSTLKKLSAAFLPDLRLTLVLLRSSTENINIVRRNTLINMMQSFDFPLFALVYREDTLCVLQERHRVRFLQALQAGANIRHYSLGISLPFSQWFSVISRYRQALFAVERAGGSDGVYAFCDCAFDYLLLHAQKPCLELELFHPCLSVLKEYDDRHHTALYRTLEAYLNNERNMVKTAEELYIHRNSMKYRMRRIRELADIDLDDPKERLYLLLSFRLAQP